MDRGGGSIYIYVCMNTSLVDVEILFLIALCDDIPRICLKIISVSTASILDAFQTCRNQADPQKQSWGRPILGMQAPNSGTFWWDL